MSLSIFGILVWLGAEGAFPLEKGLRVNRALQTTHSRRETNRLIEQGRLLVNGSVVSNPNDRLYKGDSVDFDGQTVAWEESLVEPHHRYIIKFHKPAGVVCTTDRNVRLNIVDAFTTAFDRDQ